MSKKETRDMMQEAINKATNKSLDTDADEIEQFCPWCGAMEGNPHKPNCPTSFHR